MNSNAERLGTTTRVPGELATATFDHVDISGVSGPQSGALPAPWMNTDVGATGLAGAAVIEGGIWALRGAGADVWGLTDAFHYVARPMSGDGTIVARVAAVSPGDPWAKAGLMLRSSLDPSSAQSVQASLHLVRVLDGGSAVAGDDLGSVEAGWARLDGSTARGPVASVR